MADPTKANWYTTAAGVVIRTVWLRPVRRSVAVNESWSTGTLREMLILTRSPTRGESRKAPEAWAMADSWSKKETLDAPPLQLTSMSADQLLPPKSSIWA